MKPSPLFVAVTFVFASGLFRAAADVSGGAPAEPGSAAVSPKASADKVQLRLNLQTGQKYVYRIAVEKRETSIGVQTRSTRDAKGRTVPGSVTRSTDRATEVTRTGLDVTTEVASVTPEGGAELTCRVSSVQLPNLEFHVDSVRDIKALRSHCTTILGLVANRIFTLKLAPNGKITNVVGLLELFQTVNRFYVPPSATGRDWDTDKTAAIALIDETLMWSLYNVYRSGFRFIRTLPGEPVGLASTWPETSTINAVPPLPVSTTSTVAALDEQMVRVLTMSRWPSSEPKPLASKSSWITMTGSESEDMEFDRATCLLKNSLAKMYMTVASSEVINGKVDPRLSSKIYTNTVVKVSAMPVKP